MAHSRARLIFSGVLTVPVFAGGTFGAAWLMAAIGYTHGLLTGAVYGLYLLAFVIVLRHVRRLGEDTMESGTALLFGFLLLGAITVFMVAFQDGAGQRALAERGVAATGHVDRLWTDWGRGENDRVRHFTEVALTTGSTERVETDTPEERPDIGENVTVTLDPRHRVASRFGAPPDLPDTKLRTASFTVLCAIALVFAGAVLRAAHRTPGRRRTR
ncbi:hypothetical protein [Kitasatospora sp. NPDC057223]|uniref:hypothetical protein n=1 Tax=Kitasatospora sp. NPDC057223 TaxID=3346055 RepID=UPI003628B321